MPTLKDFGIEAKPDRLSYWNADHRWRLVRLLDVLPKPASSNFPVLARFKVEEEDGRVSCWDCGAEGAISQLHELEATLGVEIVGPSAPWLEVRRVKDGKFYRYTIRPASVKTVAVGIDDKTGKVVEVAQHDRAAEAGPRATPDAPAEPQPPGVEDTA